MNRELPDVQAGFRKGRRTRDQIATISWITEKAREFQKNIYFCFIDYTKAFGSVNNSKLWKIPKEIGIPDHLTCLLRNLYAVKKQKFEMYMELQSGSKSGTSMSRLYIVTLLITFIESMSCEMPGWKKHKLESRLLGEISITSDMQMTPHLWQKAKRNEIGS